MFTIQDISWPCRKDGNYVKVIVNIIYDRYIYMYSLMLVLYDTCEFNYVMFQLNSVIRNMLYTLLLICDDKGVFEDT